MDDFQTPTRAVAMRTRLVVLEEKWPIVEDRIDAKLVGLDEGSTFRRCRRQQTTVNTPCKTCRRIAVRLFPLNFGLDLRREHFRNIYHRQSRIAGYGCFSLFHFGLCKRPFFKNVVAQRRLPPMSSEITIIHCSGCATPRRSAASRKMPASRRLSRGPWK